jgi:hypothetical protein
MIPSTPGSRQSARTPGSGCGGRSDQLRPGRRVPICKVRTARAYPSAHEPHPAGTSRRHLDVFRALRQVPAHHPLALLTRPPRGIGGLAVAKKESGHP